MKRLILALAAILCLIFQALASSILLAGTISGTVIIAGRPKKDVVISIEGIKVDKAADPAKAIMDQRNLTFAPHVLPIMVGTTVEFPNSDDVFHNVYSFSPAKKFNLGMYLKGQHKAITFDKPGVVELHCKVHSEMKAYILVKENPYYAVSDGRGKYAISNVPAGRYTLQAWYEGKVIEVREVTVPESGVVTVDFPAGNARVASK